MHNDGDLQRLVRVGAANYMPKHFGPRSPSKDWNMAASGNEDEERLDDGHKSELWLRWRRRARRTQQALVMKTPAGAVALAA